MSCERCKKLEEYLEWSLSMIDENFKETGKIGIAEVIVYKAAKSYLKGGDVSVGTPE